MQRGSIVQEVGKDYLMTVKSINDQTAICVWFMDGVLNEVEIRLDRLTLFER